VSIHSDKSGRKAPGPPARAAGGAPGVGGSAVRSGASALADELRAGCERLGLALEPAQLELLLRYLDLLRKWNAVYNLTAIRSLPRMLVEHLFDALAVVAPLARRLAPRGAAERRLCVVDIGSGAGLPGIPLAIVWPEAEVHLVDPVGKKAAFLRQCVGTLGLAHVAVHGIRVEELSLPLPADLVICRAFASLGDFLVAAAPLTGPDTLVCAMKGTVPVAEMSSLGAQWASPEVVELAVPELDATRHLVLVRRAAGRVTDGEPGNATANEAAVTVTPGARSARLPSNGA